MICPAETPEGMACGIIKNLALMANVTVGSDPAAHVIMESLQDFGMKNLTDISPSAIADVTKIFVNGLWVGIHHEPGQLMRMLRELRRDSLGTIAKEISLVQDRQYNEIHIQTDAGRVCRPLFVVEKSKLKLRKHHVDNLKKRSGDDSIIDLHQRDDYSWGDLIASGAVEYVDTMEEESAMIAMFPEDLDQVSC